jgi:AcrR family transcriptional regulator
MTSPGDFELDVDDIVAAAVGILRERGLDAVSMRSVADRLGVSPMPLYTRVGNKAALLDAVADHLLFDLAPTAGAGEPWADYAERWCRALRERLKLTPDSRLYLGASREPYVEASRPLIAALRAGGLPVDAAVQACRLLMWATVGFVAMEQGTTVPARDARRGRLSGSDPAGVTDEEADELFDLQIRMLTTGIGRLHGDVGAGP